MTVLFLILALGLILFSAELFTNGVEWLGRRYDLGEGAVGSILAAVGTALPETLVPIIAIVFTGGAAADQVGVGAILGAPFMLSSLAMLVTGTAVIVFWLRGRRSREVVVNEPIMRRDLSHFMIAYALAMGAGFLHVQLLNWFLSGALLVFYGYYVWETMRGEGAARAASARPLWFHRRRDEEPHTPAHRGAVAASPWAASSWGARGVRGAGARCISETVSGPAPLLVARCSIAPVATELPEKFNSVHLDRHSSKDTARLGQHHRRDGLPEHLPGVDRPASSPSWRLTRDSLVGVDARDSFTDHGKFFRCLCHDALL